MRPEEGAMFVALSLVLLGAGAAWVIGSSGRTVAQAGELLKELGNKWGLEYQPSPNLGLPELRGIYRSHHILFQVWPTTRRGRSTERKRLVVSIQVPFDGIIRICRRNGDSHMDILGTQPVRTGDATFDSRFLTSATDQKLTKSLLNGEIREALTEIQETEVCISSNQVRIYGEGDVVTEKELARWLEAAIQIGQRMKSVVK
jgi:hypothetical protein